MIIDFNIAYFGDTKVKVEYKGISAGIANIQFEGNLRVLLKNFTEESTPDGAEIMFLALPKFDYELLNALAPFELFSSGELFRSIIDELITEKLVFPNKITIPLSR